MAIVDEYELSKEATWTSFVTWYGYSIGQYTDAELMAEVKDPFRVPETYELARAELARREALEA